MHDACRGPGEVTTDQNCWRSEAVVCQTELRDDWRWPHGGTCMAEQGDRPNQEQVMTLHPFTISCLSASVPRPLSVHSRLLSLSEMTAGQHTDPHRPKTHC